MIFSWLHASQGTTRLKFPCFSLCSLTRPMIRPAIPQRCHDSAAPAVFSSASTLPPVDHRIKGASLETARRPQLSATTTTLEPTAIVLSQSASIHLHSLHFAPYLFLALSLTLSIYHLQHFYRGHPIRPSKKCFPTSFSPSPRFPLSPPSLPQQLVTATLSFALSSTLMSHSSERTTHTP